MKDHLYHLFPKKTLTEMQFALQGYLVDLEADIRNGHPDEKDMKADATEVYWALLQINKALAMKDA